jgi:hypothetical protein
MRAFDMDLAAQLRQMEVHGIRLHDFATRQLHERLLDRIDRISIRYQSAQLCFLYYQHLSPKHS